MKKDIGMEKEFNTFQICPGCNYFCSIQESNIFCPYCGEKLMDHCPVCGEPVKTPHADYCPKCGSLYPGRIAHQEKHKN